MSTIGLQEQVQMVRPSETSSATTERGLERVGALEHQFERKERALAGKRQENGQSVPLLLKPNGAPVFSNNTFDDTDLGQTMKRRQSSGAANELERTVKAHNFVVGKPTQNHTELAVLDVQRNSAAEEQAFPVKVLYIKPSMIKQRPKTAAYANDTQKRAIPRPKAAWGADHTLKNYAGDLDSQMDNEVSMGEVSGIFKHDRVPVKQPKPTRKGVSADQAAKAQRLQAQKEYAREIREQALQKAREQEALRRLKDRSGSRDQREATEIAPEKDAELATTAKKRMPHSENRYQGKYESLTEELFRKAQEKLQKDKQDEKMTKEEQQAKREKEKKYLEDIKQRNMEILKQQKETGNSLPPGGLKQKEIKQKETAHQQQIREDNEKRKELRQKRQAEGRATLGLDQADRSKMMQLALKKKRQQLERDEERRAKERIAREQARKQDAQREAAKDRLNKDLIDFTDPASAAKGSARAKSARPATAEEDDEAVQMEDRKAILAEQREKRRLMERIKQEEELEEKERKENQKRQLEETLRQQRMDIARRQQNAAEKQAKRARDQQKKRQAAAKSSQGPRPRDQPAQLGELRDWIEEQMVLEEQRTKLAASARGQSQLGDSPERQKTIEPAQQTDDQMPKDAILTGYQLPGNHLLPLEQERLVGVRPNRYGVNGDNGFSDIAATQAEREGYDLKMSQKENILDFEQPEASPDKKSEESYDMKPVKQSNQKRVVVNRPQNEEDGPAVKPPPGIVNVQDEAARQKAEMEKRRTWAATAIQKRVRGWQDRKKTKRLRSRMRKDLDDDRADFIQQYKMNDKYNINRYMKEKDRLRKLNKTDKIEESISENIQSSGQVDAITDSYGRSAAIGSFDQSKPLPILQNLLGRPMRASEKDPTSLIAILAKKKAALDEPVKVAERDRSKSGPRLEKRAQRHQQESRKLHASSAKKGSVKRKKPSYIDEEIEEDLPKSSNDKEDDHYSSDFQSDHISESLPSYVGSSKSKPKDAKSSSEIQESIHESVAQQSVPKKEAKPARIQASSGIQDSIPEEVPANKEDSMIEESIVDEVDPVAESKDVDEISEESYLRESRQATGSVRRPKVQEAEALPKKSERIREAIVHDYENDGAVPLAGSLKAQKMREQQEKLAQEQEKKYRMSRQIIDDFEANQGVGSDEHKKLVKGLAEELQRYEAAVSGSIFVEQFQSIVQKSLAQRDMMMLGQRLAQMEREKKHQQEIADIRAEQIKMMSQLMLLQAGSAGGGQQQADPNALKQQQEIMKNIQALVEKPIIIQRQEPDPIEESQVSKKSKDILRQSAQIQQSLKYTSVTASQLRDSHSRERKSQIEDSGQIEDDIGSVKASDDDSIEEEIGEQSQSQQLSAARRYLGSEKAVQEKSKAVIDNKAKQVGSVFDNNSFQNYTSNKFKDLLFNDGSQMDVFLDQIEAAITKKSENERKQLKKQLENNQISQKTFQKKQKDLEKWVTNERKEITQKRAKVQDTYSDIGQFLSKLEKDKNLILDKLSNQSTPRTGLRRSASQLSASNSLKDVREQIREIQDGKIGGMQPETKYLNKKREYVRQLMQEKKDAIERGVKEKLRDMESDMIDEAMQMALNLDVDKEVERRVAAAREMVAEGKIDESKKSHAIEESRVSSTMPRDRTSQKSGGKKQVRFPSPTPKEPSSSYHSGSKRDLEKTGKSDSIAEDIGDDIGESININESFQPSSASASKIRQSADISGSKRSKVSKTQTDPIRQASEQIPEEDSINSRISDMEGSYTNDFASASIQSEKPFAQSSKALQEKAAGIEESGYTDAFEEASVSQSAQMKKHMKSDKDVTAQIETVNEEEDSSSKEGKVSQQASEQRRESIKSKQSQGKKAKPAEKKRVPSVSDITDREIMESTVSVDWQVNLQQRVASSSSEHDEAAPAEEELQREPSEEQIESSIQEESSERTQEAGKGLDDLESYPSASLSKSNDQEFQLRVDQITDQLLGEVLKDFEQDPNIRMEIEDNFAEEEFEDKWPFSEAKKKQIEEKSISPIGAKKSEEDNKTSIEQQQDNEAKKKHDEAMKKYHEEQAALDAHHKKVVEYLDFMIEIVDKEVLMQALSKPIQHDPLRVLEKIQAFDTEDETDQFSKQNISTYSQVFEPYLFDEIDRQWEELHQNKSERSDGEKGIESDKGWTSKELRNVHHMAIFDAFNEALDLERPYKTKGLPNPWSKQTRVTHEALTSDQVDQIMKRARARVVEWDKTGAGTKFAPPPPPPPAAGDYDAPQPLPNQHESEEERNKAERQERLGLLLTKEVHQKENDWLDYEYEDTQVRFDLADMILEELADEVTQFLVENAEARGQIYDYY